LFFFVQAITPVTLWAMDRATFRRILMQESIRRRALYESFLAKVPIFGLYKNDFTHTLSLYLLASFSYSLISPR
jgi:hypothetical protein